PPRADGKPSNIGSDIIRALQTHITTALAPPSSEAEPASPFTTAPGRVAVATASETRSLLTRSADGAVIGVVVRVDGVDHELPASAVVLATGGFSSDRAPDPETSLLARHRPDLVHMPTTNGPWSTGDGVKMAEAVGADTLHMDQVQLHPTGFVDPAAPNSDTKFLAPEFLRAEGAILLAPPPHRAARFVDELTTRDRVTAAILGLSSPSADGDTAAAAPAATAILLWGDATARHFDPPSLAFYIKRGLVRQHDGGLADVAAARGWQPDALEATVAEHDAAAEVGGPDAFGRTVFPGKLGGSSKYYTAEVTPVLHYTMGGLRVTPEARVVSAASGRPIPGLYAAGEVAGGVHGANRLAGNSLLECAVFGRVAGASAAADAGEPTAAAPAPVGAAGQGHVEL
ncbi:hypothetical protein HK405_003476, partial [Cladochytrium tenue]